MVRRDHKWEKEFNISEKFGVILGVYRGCKVCGQKEYLDYWSGNSSEVWEMSEAGKGFLIDSGCVEVER